MPRSYTVEDLEKLGYDVRPRAEPAQRGRVAFYNVSRDGVNLVVLFYGYPSDVGTQIATSRRALQAAYREQRMDPPGELAETPQEFENRVRRGLRFVRIRVPRPDPPNDDNAPADPDPARMVAEHNNDGGADPNNPEARIDADAENLEGMPEEAFAERVRKLNAPPPRKPLPPPP